MTSAQQEINNLLSRGIDPYVGFVAARFRSDLQGWNSHHRFLSSTIITEKPRFIVEVGVWKGGSTIYMAQTLRDQSIDGVVISVDTFLGSWEHYEQPEYYSGLLHQNGYPNMFYTFLTNVIESRVQEYVQPMPLDSANACIVLARKNILADMIHIDAGHDHNAVLNDLRMWWPILRPGGVLIADDYDPEGVVWPSVRNAVNEFLEKTPHTDFEAVPYKCRFKKPV